MSIRPVRLFICMSALCVLVLCPLSDSASQGVLTRSLSGVVETLDGERLSEIKVSFTNLGEAVTSDSGKFTFNIPSPLQPGDPMEVRLGDAWVVVSPWEGKTFVPTKDGEVIRFKTAEKGDPRLLSEPRFLRQIVTDITSFLSSNLASGMDPQPLISEEARKFGFSLDQVNSAVDAWSKKAQAPYDKGLLFLYKEEYSEAIRYLQQASDSCECDQVDRFLSIADAEQKLGHYSQSEAVLIKARQIQPEDPNILTRLGRSLALQAKYSDSDQIYQLSEAICERAFGAESTNVASVLRGHGLLYEDESRYADAESLLKRALVIEEQKLGSDDPLVTIEVGNLASAYSGQGKYADAEPLYKKAIESAEKAFGPEHPGLSPDLSNLGVLYENEGRLAEAEPLLTRALALDEKNLGPEHPLIAVRLNNLAYLYTEQGKYADAERLFKRALERWTRKFWAQTIRISPLFSIISGNLTACKSGTLKRSLSSRGHWQSMRGSLVPIIHTLRSISIISLYSTENREGTKMRSPYSCARKPLMKRPLDWSTRRWLRT